MAAGAAMLVKGDVTCVFLLALVGNVWPESLHRRAVTTHFPVLRRGKNMRRRGLGRAPSPVRAGAPDASSESGPVLTTARTRGPRGTKVPHCLR